MIPAIVLAAGLSSRMGRAKATLPLGGDTFLSRIVGAFRDAGVYDVVIVVGHQADAVVAQSRVAGTGVRFVRNPDYLSGQFSSLLRGLEAVDTQASAVLMTLVDVPLVSAATIRAVIDNHRETGARVVRPTHGSQHGHPVLIDRSLFDAIRRADPAVGAKAVIRAHATAAGDFPSTDEGAFLDIDTMEEYRSVLARLSGQEAADET